MIEVDIKVKSIHLLTNKDKFTNILFKMNITNLSQAIIDKTYNKMTLLTDDHHHNQMTSNNIMTSNKTILIWKT
jgi:hypothetical protein